MASFTEAIGLDPENIPAYMGRAEMNELTTANETAWADVSEAENGAATAEALTAAALTAEEISAVSLSKLYVYYGSHENRSREGEGVWLILNPRQKRPDRVMPCITRKLRSRSFGSRMDKLC